MKYKFIGLTEYAKKHLSVEDILHLKDMIGCEIEESDDVAEIDGGRMFIMPDGIETHISFLEIEEIN